MRVGIDGACWLNRRGYGRFARALVTALAAQGGDVDYTLLIDFDPADAPAPPAGVRLVRIPVHRPATHAAAAEGRRSLRDLWATARAISRERFDVIFFPSVYTYVPVLGPGRIATVIHDVIPERFPREVFPTRRGALNWQLKLLLARWQTSLLLTVSTASKRDIAARFGIAADRIALISEAADACFRPLPQDARMAAILRRWSLTAGRFLLYVGGISPHKNLGTLLTAFAELRRDPACADYRLVLAGDYAGDVFYSAHQALRRQVTELNLGDAVVFTGYVDDTDLAYLYNAAVLFVLPSLLEGFGLPALEAMACGTPVVASARGALPELLGPAGVLFDPERGAELVEVLRRVLSDAELRRLLRRLGPERAATFSWTRAAGETLSALRQLFHSKQALSLTGSGLPKKETTV